MCLRIYDLYGYIRVYYSFFINTRLNYYKKISTRKIIMRKRKKIIKKIIFATF